MRWITTLLPLGLSVAVSAQYVTSVQDGPWSSPATWNCGCTPTPNDTVMVSHSVEITSNVTLQHLFVRVQPSGEVITTMPLAITINCHLLNEGHVLFMGNTLIQAIFENYAFAEFVGDVMSSGTIQNGAGALIQVEGDLNNQYMLGGAGAVCVTDSTINSGYITGVLDFCDQSPTTLIAPIIDENNIGVVAPTVTFCTNSPCATGIADGDLPELTLAPNPAAHQTVIRGVASNGTRIEVLDGQGRSMLVPVFRSGDRADLDLSGLSAGRYRILVRGDGVLRSLPLIIVR